MSGYAVIDIGTNTCNLLISKVLNSGFRETVYDRKLPVKLGRGGIHKDILLPDAIARGLGALQIHSNTIHEYGVSKVKVVGTSALRGAANRSEFIDMVKELLGWEIELIDGEEEAELIYRGVKLSLPRGIGKHLILDIGGGSTELILANDSAIIWKRSFNIGIARVLEALHFSDPLTAAEIQNCECWFNERLRELWNISKQYEFKTLIGCSGAFDTFMDIFEKTQPDLKIRDVTEFPLEAFSAIHHQLLHSNQEQRSKMDGMDMMRVEMIVIASIFTNFMIRRLGIMKLLHTHNSLKEGVMDKFISENLQNFNNG